MKYETYFFFTRQEDTTLVSSMVAAALCVRDLKQIHQKAIKTLCKYALYQLNRILFIFF